MRQNNNKEISVKIIIYKEVQKISKRNLPDVTRGMDDWMEALAGKLNKQEEHVHIGRSVSKL